MSSARGADRDEPSAKRQRLEAADVEQKKKMLAVVQAVHAWDNIAMFHHPVREEEVPGYSKVVTKPIDLATVSGKLKDGRYDAPEDLIDDLYLMVANAMEFNERGTVWWKHAKALRKALPGIFSKNGLAEAASDAFVPEGNVKDTEKSFLKEEKKHAENYKDTLAGMEEDMEIPIEELMAKYKGEGAKKKLDEVEEIQRGNDASSDSESSIENSDNGEEDEEGSSSSSGSSP